MYFNEDLVNNVEIIGVDVGNGFTKTVSTQFESSIKKWGNKKPGMTGDLIKYNGNYYTVGRGERVKSKTDNKDDETSLILCLAGIGYELRRRNRNNCHIVISEGLPLERCNEDARKIDQEYYLKGKTVSFEFEDVEYNVIIDDVLVNGQCVSAVIEELMSGTLPNPCLILDIGTWTVDILPVEGKPMAGKIKSLNMGVVDCINACNEEIRRHTNREIEESIIRQVMMGNLDILPPDYINWCVDTCKRYVKNLADTLLELKFNTDIMPCIFIGGGASVIKNFGGKELFPNSKFQTDIKVNAIGYEKIAKNQLR